MLWNERLQKLRELLGFKRKKHFAEWLGVDPGTYRRWERGEFEPSIKDLCKIIELARAKLGDASLDWLLMGEKRHIVVSQEKEMLETLKKEGITELNHLKDAIKSHSNLSSETDKDSIHKILFAFYRTLKKAYGEGFFSDIKKVK